MEQGKIIEALELELAKTIAQYDTMVCYMCHGGRYFEWTQWDFLNEEQKQEYLRKARERAQTMMRETKEQGDI